MTAGDDPQLARLSTHDGVRQPECLTPVRGPRPAADALDRRPSEELASRSSGAPVVPSVEGPPRGGSGSLSGAVSAHC